jgi:pyridoxal phosphate enzyme (YggS family)
MQPIAARLNEVLTEIARAAKQAERDPASVTLVAVSKTHPAETVRQALEAGQRIFGENRVQEAMGKFTSLRADYPGLELHLIGPLQTNKVREAVEFFDVIETLDRPKLAAALAKEMERQQRRPRCFIQINTGDESQKAGVSRAEAEAFIKVCLQEYRLPVEGLMCIPPLDEDPEPHFAFLRQMALACGLTKLSMGMSGDFPIAIRHGATHVRVGTAIFGQR